MEDKKVSEVTSNEINEENLEVITGGEADAMSGPDCYFEPERPFQYTRAHGYISVKCKSGCVACRCRGSLYCVDRWHLIEQDKEIRNRWYPLPLNSYNHYNNRKVIEPLTVT